MSLKKEEELQITNDSFLNKLCVKISSNIIKETTVIEGSGVLYKTSINADFSYVFTALHCILGERDKTKYQYNSTQIKSIKLVNTCYNSETTIDIKNVIQIEQLDIAIILVEKKFEKKIKNLPNIVFGKAFVKNNLMAKGYPNACKGSSLKFNYIFHDDENEDVFQVRNIENTTGEQARHKISGYSGSGLFRENLPILTGLITGLIDDENFAGIAKVKILNAKKINLHIKNHDISLELVRSNRVNDFGIFQDVGIVDYKKIIINGVELNISKAIKRLHKDLRDDWFQDSLNYYKLLTPKYIVAQLLEYIKDGNLQYKSQSLAQHFNVPKTNFATRPAIEVNLVDRVIYQAYVDFIADKLDKKLNNQVYSFRVNTSKNNYEYFFHYSIEQWKKYVYQSKSKLCEEKPYLVVADLTTFFESINLEYLEKHLNKLLIYQFTEDEKSVYKKVIANIKNLLSEWNNSKDVHIGIPQNRDASSFLANLFLSNVDEQMINSNGHKFYYRYMDDIRIVCNSKYEARKALYDLSITMREIGLNLNSSKSEIIHFEEEKKIRKYLPKSLVQIDQINSLLNSKRKRDVQIAIPMTLALFENSIINADSEPKYLTDRKLSFSISKLQQYARTPILKNLIDFKVVVEYVINEIDNLPWLCSSFVNLLRSVDDSYVTEENFKKIKDLLLDKNRNIYEGQTYPLWLLLAEKKHNDPKLISYAIEKTKNINQENNPDSAGSFLYLSSIDWSKHKGVILQSVNENKLASNYFLQKNAIVALRMVDPSEIIFDNITNGLKDLHKNLFDEKKEIFVAPLPSLKISQIIKDTPDIISF
jgi:hypothetical protein